MKAVSLTAEPVLAIAAAMALASGAFAFAPDKVDPHYDLTNLRALDWEPQSVTGLAWFGKDSLLVAEFGGVTPGETKPTRLGKLHLLRGVLGAKGPEGVTREVLAEGLAQPMGLAVKDGIVYLHEKGDRGTEIWTVRKSAGQWKHELFAKGWGDAEGYMWHSWPGGLLFHDGAWNFNVTSFLSNGYKGAVFGGTRFPPTERGAWFRLDPASKQWKIMANGMRTNEAIWEGPWKELFGPDVQGDWMPDNKILNLREGRWYGHTYGASAPQAESPPMAYCPQGEACFSPGEGVYLKKGPFKGQMLVTEHKYGGINRYSIERIGGELQAAVFDFGGTPRAAPFKGAHSQRILAGPDQQTLFYGCAGGWWVDGPTLGSIAKLSLNGSGGFEMLAIRNLGPTAFEIEFTEPPDPALAASIASYAVETFTRRPQEAYGAGAAQDRHPLAVTAVKPEGDRKVRLEFAPGALSTGTVKRDGNKLTGVGYTVAFDLRDLRSAKGEALFDTKAYYTLNQFGPGETPVPGCAQKGDANYDPVVNDPWPELCASPVAISPLPSREGAFAAQGLPGGVRLELAGPGPFRVRFFDLAGKETLARSVGAGPSEFRGFPHPGLYVAEVAGLAGATRRTVLIP